MKMVTRYITDSTNNEAKRYVQDMYIRTGMKMDGFIFVSGKQSDAKCRYNRQWLTPHENIGMTLAVPRPEGCVSLLPYYAAALVLTEMTLRDFIRKTDVFIKWPNDILIENKKISSILVEYDKAAIYMGININLDLMGQDVGSPAVDIKKYNPDVFMKDIVNRLNMNLGCYPRLFKNTVDMDFVNDRYSRVMHKLHDDVEISLDAEKLHTESGLCMGVDSEGRILLQNTEGVTNAWSVDDAALPA